MKIRKAILADVNDLWKIDQQTNAQPWQVKDYQRFLVHPRGRGWVSEDSQQVIGFMLYAVMDTYTHLVNLRVLPEFQWKTYAGILARRGLKELKKESLNPVRCEMPIEGAEAKKISKVKGLKILETKYNYYGSGKHAYVAELNLREMKL